MTCKYTEIQKARFWGKVDVKSAEECWLWKASTHNKGYGQVGLTVNKKFQMRKAHKVAYEITNDMMIRPWVHGLHKCDNRRCCNPRHIYLGTNADNMRDRDKRGRTARGEMCGNTKFTSAIVRAVKYGMPHLKAKAVAEYFDMTTSNVYQIRSGGSWAHI